MNIHIMGLNLDALLLIQNGTKTIEMRLYDDKRQKICKEDRIVFIDTKEENIKLEVKVKNLYRYDSFYELYKEFDKVKLGYKEDELAHPNDMNKFYSKEDIEKYGVIGIEVEVIN